MKTFTSLLVLTAACSTSAFAPVSQTQSPSMTSSSAQTTSLSMGLFDFFSEEARQAREDKRQREIEEQERLQQAIRERRRNPEAMEEYEAKVQQRRNLRMQGRDAEAEKVDLYESADSQKLLDGTEGMSNN